MERPPDWAEFCLALAEPGPAEKCRRVRDLDQRLDAGSLIFEVPAGSEPPPAGRPEKPDLVAPSQLARRGLGSVAGRIALIHAVAHIEFNAINLALDAMLRFPQMPAQYYRDWFSVAVDEARHFTLLSERLGELGAAYGDLPAHHGLWEMAEKTAHDPLVRMALVPRVLEARGLDVTPGMIKRLTQAGDERSVACLELILEEEVRHVAIGSRWFKELCLDRGIEAEATFAALLDEFFANGLRGPFNQAARQRAGFSPAELVALEASA